MFRARVIALMLTIGSAVPASLSARSLTVPDDVFTIQGALDQNVDTVLVRPGSYSEVPAVRWPVSLIALPGAPVSVAGLLIIPIQTGQPQPRLEFSAIHVQGPVTIRNDDVGCFLVFRDCTLNNGIEDLSTFVETSGATFRRCAITGLAHLLVKGLCEVDSCTFRGHLLVNYVDSEVRINDNTFEGAGSGTAVAVGFTTSPCSITGNTIRHYEGGIGVSVDDRAVIRGNLVENCTIGGIGAQLNSGIVADNVVRQCGDGIELRADDVVVTGNRAEECAVRGLLVTSRWTMLVDHNVVWGCANNGIELDGEVIDSARVMRNTSCLNGGSGFSIGWSYPFPRRQLPEIMRNVGCDNEGNGIAWITSDVVIVTCNDWFQNTGGDVSGRSWSGEDFSEDPQFCDPSKGDFRLRDTSPLVNRSGCGQVGALGVGCGITATLIERFEAIRVPDAVRIQWEVRGLVASDVWVERSELGPSGPWMRPMTERMTEGGMVVEIDRGAVDDRDYWYRLTSYNEKEIVMLGAPVLVGTSRKSDFALGGVFPNPGQGLVRIEFFLPNSASVDLELFDVQGRSVASLGKRGVWPAGQHVLEWDGVLRCGAMAPSGVYLVRYRYPGGQEYSEAHPVVLICRVMTDLSCTAPMRLSPRYPPTRKSRQFY